MITDNSFTPILLLPWAFLWMCGGVWLVSRVFRLRTQESFLSEEFLCGVTAGWIIQNWLANLLAWVLPLPLAFWAASGVVFAAGLAVIAGTVPGRGLRALFQWRIPWGQVALFAALVAVFFSISRGMAIFDDFQHLATISLMAAGDIPPHFALDPDVVFGYHHFIQLFAAQISRIGGLASWISVDAARALSFATAVILAGLWTRRVTNSRAAGLLAGLAAAFACGTRWMLLFLPDAVLERIGNSVEMIGSGAASGATLAEALGNPWAVEGAGKIPFPFAFANGVFPPGVIQAFTANGLTFLVVVFFLLLTFGRSQHWMSAIIWAVLIATWGLLGESEVVALAAGLVLVAAGYMIANRSTRLPASLWAWLGVAAAGCIIGLLEGGAWTDVLLKSISRITGQAPSVSYQTIGFQLAPPALVSSHLGVLSILHPATLLVALLELGPLVLVLPLLILWGIQAFSQKNWPGATLAAAAVFSLSMLFVQFTGSTGVRNTPRLYVFVPLLAAFSVALVWTWAEQRSARVRWLAAVLGAAALLGGVVLFGIELIAVRSPVYSYYLTALDARMARDYWNRLEPGGLIFDPLPYRSPALFGRATDAYLTWYEPKPEWEALRAAPLPQDLTAWGFRYAYIDNFYWEEIGPRYQQELSGSCVQTIQEWDDAGGNFRRLLDLQACQ